MNNYNDFISNSNSNINNVNNVVNEINDDDNSLNTTHSTFGFHDFNNNSINLNNNINSLSHTMNVSNQRNNLLDDLIDINKNMPISIYAPKEFYNAIYTIDFVRIGSKKEYFAFGAGDGGLRLYICEKI